MQKLHLCILFVYWVCIPTSINTQQTEERYVLFPVSSYYMCPDIIVTGHSPSAPTVFPSHTVCRDMLARLQLAIRRPTAGLTLHLFQQLSL